MHVAVEGVFPCRSLTLSLGTVGNTVALYRRHALATGERDAEVEEDPHEGTYPNVSVEATGP